MNRDGKALQSNQPPLLKTRFIWPHLEVCSLYITTFTVKACNNYQIVIKRKLTVSTDYFHFKISTPHFTGLSGYEFQNEADIAQYVMEASLTMLTAKDW